MTDTHSLSIGRFCASGAEERFIWEVRSHESRWSQLPHAHWLTSFGLGLSAEELA